MLTLALGGPLDGRTALVTGVAALALVNGIGLFPRRQRLSRDVELVCGPGHVDVKKAGSRNQRLRARHIVGATTARTANGVCVTLQHRRREQPIAIEVDTDADAEKLRHALGIGHHGFGTLAWRTTGDGTVRAAYFGRVIALVFGLVGLAAGLSDGLAFVSAPLVRLAVMGALVGIAGLVPKRSDATVVMTAEGLRLKSVHGWFALPYAAVLGIESSSNWLTFKVPAPFDRVAVERSGPTLGGLSDSDAAVLIAQIEAAAKRAQGRGPSKDDASARVEVLRRRGEPLRDWLVRLDMAGQTLSAAGGYRGTTLDPEDLWTILEDPEAKADLRAAAARVLRHVPAPSTRIRIDAALAAVRDEATERRLRVALRDDVDRASEELTALEEAEPRRQAR
jgi:hypothetical protein